MSTKPSFAPEYKTAFAVAMNVRGTVKTRSLGFQLSAIPLKCKAAVPLETATVPFALNIFLICSSNKETFGPCVIYFDFRESETLLISS